MSYKNNYITLGSQHRIAVCFSGLVRQLEYTHKRWKDYFATFPCPYDIFAFIGEDDESYKMKKYFPQSIVKIKKDPSIDPNHPLVKRYLRIPLNEWRCTAWVLQIYKYQQVNLMRKEREKQHNIKYDILIRLRTDLLPSTEYYFPKKINMNVIYIEDIGHGGGVNDRFALGNSNLMDTYMNIYDSFNKPAISPYNGSKWAREIYRNYYAHKQGYAKPTRDMWYGKHFYFYAEVYLSHWLRLNNIKIKLLHSKADYIKQSCILKNYKYKIGQGHIISDWHFPWHIQLFWQLRYKIILLSKKLTITSIIHWTKYFLRTNRLSGKLYARLKRALKK